MRVAGGELLAPTLVLLFAVDTKLAGSLSLRPTLRRPAVRSVRPSDCRWRSLGSPMTSKTTVLMPPDRARGPRGKLVD